MDVYHNVISTHRQGVQLLYFPCALWTPAYIPTDCLTSWDVLHHPCTVPVYKLLFIRQYTSAVLPLIALTSTVVTLIRLYPLHSTLYCCTLTSTLTRRQSSAKKLNT
jgi:hypothetical protein